MSTKKKILISLCSICLVAAVVVIGVFAFATQTFTLNNRVTFTANDVKADVAVFGMKQAIDANDFYMIEFADGSNKLWTEDENDFFNGMGQPGDGESDGGLSWSINAAAGSDLNTTYSVPDQDFRIDGAVAEAIALFVWVVNQGDKAFTVTMTDSYLESLKNVDNVTITSKFYKTNGFKVGMEGSVFEMPTTGGTAAENGVTLAKGEGCLVKIIYQLNDVGLNTDVNQAHQFVLQAV